VFPKKPGLPTTELSEKEWDWLMRINLKGVFLCTQAVAREMIKRGKGGRIVNVSSIAGLIGSRSGCHYAASKGGVISLTYSWAEELGRHGILVNAVAPGYVRTKLTQGLPSERVSRFLEETPSGRFSTTEDIAEAIVFLATAPNLNGQVLVVDGGRVKH
jgi:3-oxoacyl-[acyl-carrier protein] reductase